MEVFLEGSLEDRPLLAISDQWNRDDRALGTFRSSIADDVARHQGPHLVHAGKVE